MSTFFVNGKSVTTTRKQSLLRFLRDELKLTSVKDGCSQGACGACTVIIDGETCRACVPISVEGITDWESKVYTYAYGEAGAVQCGFCIPGMVMCTKALLDKNPDPTEAEIRYAIRNNYCRCTGYVKIIAAIRLAAKIKREGIIPEDSATDWKIGSRVHRLDVEEKVLGYGKYPDDFYFDNMCYGSAVRSKYPRARVLSIDISAAKALPGVVAVLTAEDVPGENLVGHLKHDQYTLIPVGGLTHYLGDAIALVVAEDRETLEKAKKLVKVEYEVLPAIHNIEEAAAPDAPLVYDEETSNVQAYKHVCRGNAEEAIKHAAHVISHHFETPWTEHAFLEPECAVAFPYKDGVKVYSTDQHAMIPDVMVMSAKVWKTISPQDQNIILEAARESTESHKIAWDAAIDEAIQEAESQMGVEFVNDVDKDAFRQATSGMIDDYCAQYPGVKELLDTIDSVE